MAIVKKIAIIRMAWGSLNGKPATGEDWSKTVPCRNGYAGSTAKMAGIEGTIQIHDRDIRIVEEVHQPFKV
ncbi:MAG TPA: hypothetical protein VLM19_00385 [Nitrospiraceae bacterium]|nr:hypothetical protein [Nitrospiraceae bacterium]